MNTDKRQILLLGICFSLIIFVLLFVLKLSCPQLLDIDSKWLIVAGSPILLALIIGQFIKTFKGMGIELEMHVNVPVIENPSLMVPIEHVDAKDKGGLNTLSSISTNDKLKVNVLRFSENKVHYYGNYAILKYLDQLPNVSFFEIIDDEGHLKWLIDIREIKFSEEEQDNIFINELINAIDRKHLSVFLNQITYATKDKITIDEKLLNVYELFIETNKNVLPVVNKHGDLIGLVFKQKIQEVMINQIIKIIKRHEQQKD